MENNLTEFIQQFKQIYQQKNEYDKNVKKEIFNDDETKDSEELIKEAENMLDRRMQEKERIDIMEDLFNNAENTMKIIQKEMKEMKMWIKNEDKRLTNEGTNLMEMIQKIRMRETLKRNNEIRNTWMSQIEENKERRRKTEMKEKLSELIGLEVKDVLFDSDKHKWSVNDSEFGKRLNGHRHVCIVVEDTNGNIFGGYCSKEIGIYKFHFDEKSFLFSMKRNNEYIMKKYPLKKGKYDLIIGLDSDDALFGFGAAEKNNEFHLMDICVCKKDSIKKNYCYQYSYEYNNETNALCGSIGFEVKRIIAYEMKETNQMKEHREKEEQEEREREQMRWKNEKEEVERRINEMTEKQIDKILFDTEMNKWSENDSEFHRIMKGKKNVILLVEDERMNLFGGYIGNEIVIQQDVKDETCYVFSLRKNGEYKPKKYERNNNGSSYCIGDDSNDKLISFGTTNDVCKDLFIRKRNYSCGWYKQHCYEYNNEQFALRGKCYFNIKRIILYQLK